MYNLNGAAAAPGPLVKVDYKPSIEETCRTDLSEASYDMQFFMHSARRHFGNTLIDLDLRSWRDMSKLRYV